MTRTQTWVLFLALMGAAVGGLPSDAHACGGCFHPPEGSPAPVSGHRMAVAISPRGTTLWDQIQYEGAPEDFVWVLPVMGTPMVELADNGFFEALTAATTIVMQAPPPPRTFCSDPCEVGSFGVFASGRAPTRADETDPTVEVHYEGVVGPYETATIGSADPGALITWLNDHGYAIPASIEGTIAYYVGLGANFVALRLAPASGIDRMQPVRVTSPGLSLSFPLRMVEAGVQVSVDLELFVFAEGRMEAANFGNAEVLRANVAFDWATRTFGYEAEFESALFAGEGEGTNWVTEYAEPADLAQLRSYRTFDAATGEAHSPEADLAVVTAAIDAPYLTRLRTRLPPAELNRDLLLRASTGGDVPSFFRITRELNRAPEPSCPDYCSEGTGLGPGGGSSRGTGSSLRCSAIVGRASPALLLGLVLGALLLAARRGRPAA